MVRTFVVHRHHVVAETLSRRLNADPMIRAVGVASTPGEARAAMSVLQPDVVVIDVEVEHGSAFTFMTELTEGSPRVGVVAIIDVGNGVQAIRAIRAGANAVARSEGTAGDLVAAVLAVGNGDGWLPPPLLGLVLRELRASQPPPNRYVERLSRLTSREREVLDHMVAGHDRAMIARSLTVSLNTVRTHTQNILTKLEVHSGLEAVSLARRARDQYH